MTSRTRPAPRCTTDRRPAPLAALALLSCVALTGACGALSRPMFAQHDASLADTPAKQSELLGADPMIAPLWLWSAQRQTSPAAALGVIEHGRRFHPDDPDLMLSQASLLSLLHRNDEVMALARGALQTDTPTVLEAELRWMLVLADLAGNDTAAAQQEVLRLGGVRGVEPAQVADAWARVAVTDEFLGHPGQADEAFERSLDLGPGGLLALRSVAALEPQREAACQALRSRARSRHPDDPDLAIQAVVSALLAQDAPAAETALGELPSPLPARLEPDVELLRVRVDILAGRTESALDVLRARLDDDPTDADALAVLIECWRSRQVPSKQELRQRLTWASGRLGHPALEAQVRALLRELSQPATGAPPDAEPASGQAEPATDAAPR